MKTATAGEGERGLDNGATGLFDSGPGLFEILAVENDQGAAVGGGAGQVGFEEAALDNVIGKGGVVRAVIRKRPAKGVAEKVPGFG